MVRAVEREQGGGCLSGFAQSAPISLRVLCGNQARSPRLPLLLVARDGQGLKPTVLPGCVVPVKTPDSPPPTRPRPPAQIRTWRGNATKGLELEGICLASSPRRSEVLLPFAPSSAPAPCPRNSWREKERKPVRTHPPSFPSRDSPPHPPSGTNTHPPPWTPPAPQGPGTKQPHRQRRKQGTGWCWSEIHTQTKGEEI